MLHATGRQLAQLQGDYQALAGIRVALEKPGVGGGERVDAGQVLDLDQPGSPRHATPTASSSASTA